MFKQIILLKINNIKSNIKPPSVSWNVFYNDQNINTLLLWRQFLSLSFL